MKKNDSRPGCHTVGRQVLDKGRVCLVGAGPGDPELLTVKAASLIRSADVILHDALVSQEILALAPPTTRRIDVGKRCGRKNITQNEINHLLIKFASEGKLVVRLKSGDPGIFGRAGEEIEALRKADVAVEIVPGITAALAGAASALTALTDRRCANRLLLITAHHAHGGEQRHLNLTGMDLTHTTLVIYMPGNAGDIAGKLIYYGLESQTPCILISKISMPEEQVQRSTLDELRVSAPLPSPCLLIIGEIVSESARRLHQGEIEALVGAES